MLHLLLSYALITRPTAAAFHGADCRSAIPKNESVDGRAGHANMVSSASVIYVRTAPSMFVPLAYEYQTYGAREFIQFLGQGAVVPFVPGARSFSMTIYRSLESIKRSIFRGSRLQYPLNYVQPKMVTRRYACDPRLWSSG